VSSRLPAGWITVGSRSPFTVCSPNLRCRMALIMSFVDRDGSRHQPGASSPTRFDPSVPESRRGAIPLPARPQGHDSTPLTALESARTFSLAPSPLIQPATRHSWSEAIALLAVAVAGTVALVQLAYHVTTPQSEGNGGIIVRTEVVSLWMHPAHFDLAQHPAQLAACRSLDGYRRYAEQRGLEKAWYVITTKSFQINGHIEVISTITKPYEMIEPYYSEFLGILALAAGHPPQYASIDFMNAKVCVIPNRLLHANARTVLDELRMLEDIPQPQIPTNRVTSRSASRTLGAGP
jgi:hypothetical protein